MTKAGIVKSCMMLLLLFSTLPSRADVKTEEKSRMKFEGVLGKMMGLFGGKAAKEGITSTVAVQGNRKVSFTGDTGEIIDLDEEKIYNLDLRKKQYRVTTFAELRRQMEEARTKAKEARKSEEPAQPAEGGQPQMEIDFSLKESGQQRTINGFDCREVVMTITMREKGKTLEEGGGMLMTTNIWLGPEIPYMKEIEQFNMRYAEKLNGPFAMSAAEAQQVAAALAMYPGMQEMLGKFQAEKVNMDGTEILTVSSMESVKSAAQQEQEQQRAEESQPPPTSVSGLGGLLGRKLMKKKPEESGRPANRSLIFTSEHELLRASPSVGAVDLALPAGFKEVK